MHGMAALFVIAGTILFSAVAVAVAVAVASFVFRVLAARRA
jgi:hypothetical protein